MADRTLIRAQDVRALFPTNIPRTTTEEDFAIGRYFEADCTAAESAGDCVYVSAARASGFAQVRTIDPTASPVEVFVGVVLKKASATRCTVQRFGEYAVPYSVGLAPALFVAPDGTLTATPPAPGVGQIVAVQAVATGVDTDVVLLQPGWQILKRRG